MSRIMLAIKSLASLDRPGKTLIFDEVDSGIGGRVADAVGGKLRALGGTFQVLCITHLPQIAAYGNHHFRIGKQVRAGRTSTEVDPLDRSGREDELARMIGGADITAAARESAREMLSLRQGESETKAKAKAAGSNDEALRISRSGDSVCIEPMARKYLIETFGCQMNFHDSERMAGLLEQAGYEPTDREDEADLVLLNTCSVREHAAEKLFSRLGELKPEAGGDSPGPVIAVAGCVAQQEGKAILRRAPHVSVVVGTQASRQLPVLVEQAEATGRAAGRHQSRTRM